MRNRAWTAWGAGAGAHMWAGWGGFAEQPGGIIRWKCFFFFFPPVKQFSEHFPWNILTLEFKISAADMWGVERQEPKLAAGNCVCQQRCQWGPGIRCQVTVAGGRCLPVPPHQGFKGGFPAVSRLRRLCSSPPRAARCPKGPWCLAGGTGFPGAGTRQSWAPCGALIGS